MADQDSSLPVKDSSDGVPGSAVPSIAIQVGGSDGTNLRTLSTDTSGKLKVSLTSEGLDGSTAPVNSVQVGGKDGSGNLQSILTDVNGVVQTVTKIALTPASPTSASVGVTSASVVAFNANRKGLVLTNVSSTKMFFGLGVAAVLNSGIALYPGGVWVMDEYNFTIDSISAIAPVASSTLAIQEFNT